MVAAGLVAFGFVFGVSVRAMADEASCYRDWSDAAKAVKQHGLVSVDRLGVITKHKVNSHLVRTKLCKTGKGFVYDVVVRDRRGKLKRFNVNAKRPMFMRGSLGQ